ncbi:MAG: gliding motility-associated C-terminal domain-containing protein [Chitinophagales bacterium]|nr:gliding motility-associated C-terminal domain-containing protein [Chitinophagales bacterium]
MNNSRIFWTVLLCIFSALFLLFSKKPAADKAGFSSSKSLYKAALPENICKDAVPAEQPLSSKLSPTITKDSKDAAKSILSDKDFRKNLNENMNIINFIQNKGQFGKDVLYAFTTTEAKMYVFKDKIRLVSSVVKKDRSRDIQQVDIKFQKSNHFYIEPVYTEDGPEYSWFTGNGNYTGIKSANELKIRNVYKGIDLRLYSNVSGSLEFDWIVEHANDYGKIKMQLFGQDSLSTDANGNLQIHLKSGNLALNIPATYQINEQHERETKNARFLVDDNLVAYTIEETLNEEHPLVIDPKLIWGSFMDGASSHTHFDSYMYGGVLDKSGNVYVCGGTETIDSTEIQNNTYGNPEGGFRTNPPSDSARNNYGVDWLILKINPSGSKVLNYTFYSGSTSDLEERPYCINISPENNTIFVGGYSSGILPALSDGYTKTSYGGTNGTNGASLAVFSADLKELKYRTYIGTSASSISSIEVLNDTTYILGGTMTQLTNLFGSFITGPDFLYGGGLHDMYIAQFTSYNILSWGTYIGGDEDDIIHDMRLMPNGDIAFCGSTKSSRNSFTGWDGNSFINDVAVSPNTEAGEMDGIVGVLKKDGTAFSMLSKVGGSGDDKFTGLTMGPCNTLYLCGSSSSNNYPFISQGVLQTSNAGAGDIVLFKCSASGGTSESSATYFGGSGYDEANSIAFLPIGIGRLFIFGTTASSNISVVNTIPENTFYKSFLTPPASEGSTIDMLFIECSSDLKEKYLATYLGGFNNDYLGNTGETVTGKQMLLFDDLKLFVFTTTHSPEILPGIISGGFDLHKSNDQFDLAANYYNDSWVMFKLDFKEDIIPYTDAGDAPLIYGRVTASIKKDTSDNALLTLGNRIDDDQLYPSIPGVIANFDDNEGNTLPRKPNTLIYYKPGVIPTPTNANDEDALLLPIKIDKSKQTFSVDVPFYNNSGYKGNIYGFIDFNVDGDFNDVNERVVARNIASNDSSDRIMKMTWNLGNCSQTDIGKTYLRLILTNDEKKNILDCSTGNISYLNSGVGFGEVEDYQVLIVDSMPCNLTVDDPKITTIGVSSCSQNNGKIILGNLHLNGSRAYKVFYRKDNNLSGPISITSTPNGDSLIIPNVSVGFYYDFYIESPNPNACCHDSIKKTIQVKYSINCPVLIHDTCLNAVSDSFNMICIPVYDNNIDQVHSTRLCRNPANGTLQSRIYNMNAPTPHYVCLTYKSNNRFAGKDTICLITCDNFNPAICDTHTVCFDIKLRIMMNGSNIVGVNATECGQTTGKIILKNLRLLRNHRYSLTYKYNNVNIGPVILKTTASGDSIILNNTEPGTYTGFTLRPVNDSSFSADSSSQVVVISPGNCPVTVRDTCFSTKNDSLMNICLPISDLSINQLHTSTLYKVPIKGTVSGAQNINNTTPHKICFNYKTGPTASGNDSIYLITCDNYTPKSCDTTRICFSIQLKIKLNTANATAFSSGQCLSNSGSIILSNLNLLPAESYKVYYTYNNLPKGPFLITTTVTGDTMLLNNLQVGTYSNFIIETTNNASCCKDTIRKSVTINAGGNCPVIVNDTCVSGYKDVVNTICIRISDANINQLHATTICRQPVNGAILGSITNNNIAAPHQVCLNYKPNDNFAGKDSICLISCDNFTDKSCDTHRVCINTFYPINLSNGHAATQNYSACNSNDGKVVLYGLQLLSSSSYHVFYMKDNIQYGPLTQNSSATGDSIILDHQSAGLYSMFVIESNNDISCCRDTIVESITILNGLCPFTVNDTSVTIRKNDSTSVCVSIHDANLNQLHSTIICKHPEFGTIYDTVYNLNTTSPHMVCIDYTPDRNYSGKDTICLISCSNAAPVICDTHQIYIVIRDIINIDNLKDIVFLPTAFTPNGDGNNDVFMVRMEEGLAVVEQLIIFDRWGNKIFERNNCLPNNPLDGWDGSYKGAVVPPDAYAYYIALKFVDGQRASLRGNVIVIK